MPKRITVALSLTWHELEASEVLPMVEALAKMLHGTGVVVELPDQVAKQLPEETVRSLGMVPPEKYDSRRIGFGYAARGLVQRAVLEETVRVWRECGGIAKRAADELGVDRNTVYNRMTRARRLGLVPEEVT